MRFSWRKKIFFDKFQKLLCTVKETYELDNIHDALIVWFAENYLLLDPEDIQDRIVQDAKAEGIDAVLIDKKKYELLFIQAKTTENFDKTSNEFPENDVKLAMAGARLLIGGDYKGKITPELENLVDEYHDLDKTGDYKTKILFLALKGSPSDTKFIEDFKKDFSSIEVDFWDFDRLSKFYEDEYLVRRAQPPERISFEISKMIMEKDEPMKSRIFTVSGKDLARNYDLFKERMFQQNVRQFLGFRSKGINKQILSTATSDESSKHFWYYNNGVTIVCKKITDSASKKSIHLEEAQIINGAQTTYSLFEAFKSGELKDDVEILVKSIETSDRQLIDKITLYTNSQNAIRLRDLCSNEEIQTKIQKVIMDSYGYFYERKRGEFDSAYPTKDAKIAKFGQKYKDKLINNENAAQAFLAMFLDRPAQAKNEKKRLFMKDGGFYDDVFGIDDSNLTEKILLSWRLLKFVETKKKEYKKTSKKADELPQPQKDDIYKKDFLLHSEYFIVNLFKDFLREKGYDLNDGNKISEIISKIESDDGQIIEIYNKIIESMTKFFLVKKTEHGYYHNKFFKSDGSIATIRDSLNKDFNFIDKLQ